MFVMDDDRNINYANILHAWISRKVGLYLCAVFSRIKAVIYIFFGTFF